MGDYLTLYRLLTGRFCNACKRLKSSQPVLRLVQVEICREVIALFLIATALAVSGDVESNPGPNNRNCEACGNKDSPGLAYFSFPLNRALQWARALGRDDLAKLSADYLHRYCHVCARHFVPSMMNAHKSRLLHHAVPTVDICVGNSTATMNDNEPDPHIKTDSPLAGMKSIGPICCVSLSPTHAAPTVQQFYESKDHVNGAYSVNCLSPNHLSPNEANCPCKYPITQSAQLTRTVSLCDTDNFNISMPTTRVHVARYISTPKIINKTVSSQTNLYLSTIAPCEQTCGVKCMQASNCRKDDVF